MDGSRVTRALVVLAAALVCLVASAEMPRFSDASAGADRRARPVVWQAGPVTAGATSGLHSTRYGETGPRVAFLHGLFGQGRNWTQIGKALAAAGHRVDLLDLPNHGRSSWLNHWNFADVADRVADHLRQGSDPLALVGHSLGGKVAMVLALRHPDLVERLCVVDVSPVVYQRASEFGGYIAALKAIDLETLDQRAEAETALADAVPQESVRAFLLQNLRREQDGWRWQANLDGLDRDLAAIGSWPEEELAGTPPYAGPVLWMAGQNSDYVEDAYAPAMDRWFPRNRRVTIKNAGHWVHSQQPEVFTEVLRRFLDAEPGAA